jgi:hypothetical protein
MGYKIAVVVSIFIILAILNKLTARNNQNPHNRR